ncbi:MAG: hypothetical protein ACLGH0_02875 [Thermoanaerobaculia bacterium]
MLVSIKGVVPPFQLGVIFQTDPGTPNVLLTVVVDSGPVTLVGPFRLPFATGIGVYRGIVVGGGKCIIDCGGAPTGCKWEIVDIT